jgi:hypothetical protein
MTGLVGSKITQREKLEGDLASLGIVLVRLELIQTRNEMAARSSGLHKLLSPALDDIKESRAQIQRVQHHLSALTDELIKEAKP